MERAARIASGPSAKSHQLDLLLEQGFLAIRNVTSVPDVARIRAISEDLFSRRVGYREGQYFNLVGDDAEDSPPVLPQLLSPRLFAPALRATDFYAAAHRLAVELIGEEAELSFDHLIKKPAFEGATTPWHQDEAFRDGAFDWTEISIWLPLQPVDERNGCLLFIPGTNRGDVLPHRSPGGDDTTHALECYAGFDPEDRVPCRLGVGDCSVHLGRTVHGAGPNLTAADRYAYIMVFALPKRARSQARRFAWQESKIPADVQRRRAFRRSPAGVWSRARRFAAALAANAHRMLRHERPPTPTPR